MARPFERENGPGITRAASEVTPPRGTAPSVAQLVDHLEQVQLRVLQEAMSTARASYWRKRADDFEWARPSLTDFPGDATLDQRRMRWRELTEVATACRNRAAVSLLQADDLAAEVDLVLEELVA